MIRQGADVEGVLVVQILRMMTRAAVTHAHSWTSAANTAINVLICLGLVVAGRKIVVYYRDMFDPRRVDQRGPVLLESVPLPPPRWFEPDIRGIAVGYFLLICGALPLLGFVVGQLINLVRWIF